jgi:hypothetical protein
MVKEIIYRHEGGEVSVEASGFSGKGCQEHVEQAITMLGGEAGELTKKPEFYDNDTETQKETE